jgi:hypothetical protein
MWTDAGLDHEKDGAAATGSESTFQVVTEKMITYRERASIGPAVGHRRGLLGGCRGRDPEVGLDGLR